MLEPAIATVVIIEAMAIYNGLYLPFLYMPSRELGVISTSLFRFHGPFSAQWEVISAGVVIVTLPALVDSSTAPPAPTTDSADER